jgi:hypothetical protein
MLGVHNPVGADYQKIWVVMQRLPAAAQPERWTALGFSKDSTFSLVGLEKVKTSIEYENLRYTPPSELCWLSNKTL